MSSELYSLVLEKFAIAGDRVSILGHSMGGHGALVLGLREPTKFRSISALSPIVNPTKCPWGVKAFKGFLGDAQDRWDAYDATELIRRSGRRHPHTILIDQGLQDEFLETQLLTSHFEQACREAAQPCEVRMQAGYDHSYYFIATFIADHLAFHAQALSEPSRIGSRRLYGNALRDKETKFRA